MSTQTPPLKLVMILHFYASREPFPPPSFGSSAYQEFLTELINDEIITPYYGNLLDPEPTPNVYDCTRKGEVFVEALKSVPYPVLQYVMPGNY